VFDKMLSNHSFDVLSAGCSQRASAAVLKL